MKSRGFNMNPQVRISWRLLGILLLALVSTEADEHPEADIEAFLASMKDEPDWYVQVYLQEVDATFALAQKHLEAVQATGTPASSECSVVALQQTIHEVSGITVEAMSDLQEGDALPEGLVSKLLLVEAPECLEAYVEHTYEFLHWSGKLRECQKEHTSCPYEEFAVRVYSQVAYWKLSEAWAQLVAVD